MPYARASGNRFPHPWKGMSHFFLIVGESFFHLGSHTFRNVCSLSDGCSKVILMPIAHARYNRLQCLRR